METTTWWGTNKVFVIGLLTALATALLPFYEESSQGVKFATIGYALLIAVLTYFARNWRGQTNSIVGILVATGGVAANLLGSGLELNQPIFYIQLVIQAGLLFAQLSSPDAKSRGYEATATIATAKKEGEMLVPAALTDTTVKVPK